MRNRLARFLLIFAACVLPLQTLAAINMQLPMLGGQQQAPTSAEEAHCPYHAASDAGQSKSQDQACKNCGICHLAATGYVPSAEVKTGIAPQESVFETRPSAGLHSHIPEPPQYPPKRSA